MGQKMDRLTAVIYVKCARNWDTTAGMYIHIHRNGTVMQKAAICCSYHIQTGAYSAIVTRVRRVITLRIAIVI